MWGFNDWGSMIWGTASPAVPLLSPSLWLGLCAALIVVGVVALQHGRLPPINALAGLAIVCLVPLIALAQSVSVPHTFENGTVADADEVNANFDALILELEDLRARVAALEAATQTNACGGTSTLVDEPGASCGSCGLDSYVCDSPDSTICDGNTTANACGGCTTLVNPPGDTCGQCGLDLYTCVGLESTVCNGDSTNACGGCATLSNTPGGFCGPCLDGIWICSGQNTTVCQGASPGPICP